MFKNIPGFEDYSVSMCGKVKSNRRNRLLSIITRRDGYKELGIRADKKKYIMLVHRLVAMTYIPNPDNKPCVNHLDSDRGNNSVENLEWCTYKENLEHASGKGRLVGKKGETSSSAVMSNETCHLICKEIEKGVKLKAISDKYGINIKTISNIKNGKRWLEISSQYTFKVERSRRLSASEILDIVRLAGEGCSAKEISREVGTTPSTVSKHLRRNQSSTAIPKGSRVKQPEIVDS